MGDLNWAKTSSASSLARSEAHSDACSGSMPGATPEGYSEKGKRRVQSIVLQC